MIAAFLLAAASPPPAVQEEVFGDWTTKHVGGTVSIATTVNSAGAVFGAVCYGASCRAFFNPKIDCKEGQEFPALVNAPAAAYNVTLTCAKIADIAVYELPLEGAISDAMSVGGVLGIAFPMESGEFKVSRFSLTGAARASASAAQQARGEREQPSRASDNQTL